MSEHSHISAIFDNAFQSRAGSPDVYMSMVSTMDVVIRDVTNDCEYCILFRTPESKSQHANVTLPHCKIHHINENTLYFKPASMPVIQFIKLNDKNYFKLT